MGKITGYHVHVYFAKESLDKATEVCERARDKFELDMGRMHEKAVGPHPMWSCRLAVDKTKFGRVIPWFAMNRNGLTIFIHPESGDDLLDHTAHAIWMGEMLALNLSAFE